MVVAKLSIVAIVLLISFVLLHIVPIKELFTSSTQLIMDSQQKQGFLSRQALANLDKTFADMQGLNSLDDSKHIMQAIRCYQFNTIAGQSPRTVSGEANVFVDNIRGLFSSMTQIEDRIYQSIVNFKDAIKNTIEGNVYVLIYQVPYYKNERGNTIHAGYYINNTLEFVPSNMRNDVFYDVQVIYGNYDKDKKLVRTSSFETSWLPAAERLATNDKQCFIRCVNTNKMCGCATSQPGLYADDPTYAINCFGRDSAGNQFEKSTFSILYKINKQENSMARIFT